MRDRSTGYAFQAYEDSFSPNLCSPVSTCKMQVETGYDKSIRKDLSYLALLRTEPGCIHPLYQFCQISHQPFKKLVQNRKTYPRKTTPAPTESAMLALLSSRLQPSNYFRS